MKTLIGRMVEEIFGPVTFTYSLMMNGNKHWNWLIDLQNMPTGLFSPGIEEILNMSKKLKYAKETSTSTINQQALLLDSNHSVVQEEAVQ